MTTKQSVIYSRSPVRFDFSGGPTDVAPFSVKEGGIVVNTALNLYATARLEPRLDKKIFIRSHDLNLSQECQSISELPIGGPLKLIQAIISHIRPNRGFSLETKSDVPPGSGLGSSAALTVATLAALRAFQGYQVPDPDYLVHHALEVENNLLNNINGGQDQIASSYGGFNKIEWRSGKIFRSVVQVPRRAILTLEERSILCYSGSSHISGKVLDKIMVDYENGSEKIAKNLRQIKTIAKQAEIALLKSDINKLSELIYNNYACQNQLYNQMSNQNIKEIFTIGNQLKINGGKVAGAGGGGCVLLICRSFTSQILKQRLRELKYVILPFSCAERGVEVWFEQD